jgi:hypothetical protein
VWAKTAGDFLAHTKPKQRKETLFTRPLGDTMNIVRYRPLLHVVMLIAMTSTLVAWAGTPVAKSASLTQGITTIDPSDPRLVPNPIESSDEGTIWSCRFTGPEVQCTSTLTFSWELQEGPGELFYFCAVPIYSVNGTFTRTQTRYYTYDAASGQFLEYKRLIHLYSNEYFTPIPDPNTTNVVIARLNMTWISTFQTPGDLDSRVTQKQGIDTFIKPPNGRLVVLDVGQKMTVLGEDFDFRGRWDIALGDPAVEFGKVCSALGL